MYTTSMITLLVQILQWKYKYKKECTFHFQVIEVGIEKKQIIVIFLLVIVEI